MNRSEKKRLSNKAVAVYSGRRNGSVSTLWNSASSTVIYGIGIDRHKANDRRRHKTATRRLVFRLCIIQETIPGRGDRCCSPPSKAQSPHSNQPPDPDLTMRLRPYTSGIRTGQAGTDCFVRGTLCARPSRVGWRVAPPLSLPRSQIPDVFPGACFFCKPFFKSASPSTTV
jgi:hypothetical protein